MICRICGFENNGFGHATMIDCVNTMRAYIAYLLEQIADLRCQLPPGEATFVSPIGRGIVARLWIVGDVEPSHIDRLIQVIELLKDTFPRKAESNTVYPLSPEDEMAAAGIEVSPE